MGEIAEDMVSGICCSDCGMYFQHPKHKGELFEHGYPVVCQECWNEYTKQEKEQAKNNGLTVAIVETL